MQAIRATQKLNDVELASATPVSASWHNDYRDTAFIYIGGLPYNVSEGDVITVFSQYGNPNYLNLIRDKETGKSKGFCFLRYEDQRSTDLAVDNLGGANVMGRMLRVDHTRYKPKDGEEIYDNTTGQKDASGGDDHSGEESEDERPMLQEEKELQRLKIDHDDDDPMKAYLVEQKQEEVSKALEKYRRDQASDRKSGSQRRHHRHRRYREKDRGDEKGHRHRRVGERDNHRRRHRSRSRSPRNEDGSERRRDRPRRSSSPRPEGRKDNGHHHPRSRGRRDSDEQDSLSENL